MESKRGCYEDPFAAGCNPCSEESLSPGCWDPYCSFRVCNQLNATTCCEFAWSEDCVAVAEYACNPEVVPIPLTYDVCPAGFICDEDFLFMSNCTDIRNVPVELRLGDLYAGTLCLEGDNGFSNCPIGHYCPDPETQIICPAEKFCPYKAAEPWLDCLECGEGATEQSRDLVVVILLALFMLINLIIVVVIRCLTKKTDEAAKLQSLASRLTSSRTPLPSLLRRKKQDLEKMRPKLEIISNRLEKATASSNRSLTLIGKDDRLTFDAQRLFDAIDMDKNGDLEYDELNVILGFDEVELKHFFDKMQNLAGMDTSETSVTKAIFCKHFLEALDDTLHLKVTPQEAGELYDEIIKANEVEVLKGKMLYASSVSRILSDFQIFQLIKVGLFVLLLVFFSR